MNCEQCNKENNNGTKFCSHKCRVKWVTEHNIKGQKKKVFGNYGILERKIMSYGSNFNNQE